MPAFTQSDWIATASGIISLIALFVAVYAIRRSNRNASVATVVTLNEGFRQAWHRFLTAQGTARDYEFAELMNLLEIACAIEWEESLTGVSREIASEYLAQNLQLLQSNDYAREKIQAAVHAPTTFKYISLVFGSMKKGGFST